MTTEVITKTLLLVSVQNICGVSTVVPLKYSYLGTRSKCIFLCTNLLKVSSTPGYEIANI